MFIASITEVALHTTISSSSANHTQKHHSYLRCRHEYINTGKLLNKKNCKAVLGIQLGCRHSAKCPQATLLSSDLDLHSLLPQPVIQQPSMVTGHSHHLVFYAFESFDLPCWYTTFSASV